ncbi:MAG: DNA-3-methyladenine glycosylase 2 family protein [Candidatus Dormibacteraeota bacterium]|nr:DNA-3-methyladenine glycosylase 2 family protein [Candidatus Dormibacteraeota bacterium]
MAAELARRDPALARIIQMVGPPLLREAHGTHFEALVRSITFQQLAGAAAAAIHGRLVTALDGRVTPESVLAQPDERLRGAGLSGSKMASIRDLAARAVAGIVPLDDLDSMTDDEVVAGLSQVRGIGRWTAEMFLMFQLRRPDVWPVDDLGVRKGYAKLHGLEAPPPPKALAGLGDPYRPYRSAAAWYCWRAAETVLPD